MLFLLLGWFWVTAVASLGNALAGKFNIFIDAGSDGKVTQRTQRHFVMLT